MNKKLSVLFISLSFIIIFSVIFLLVSERRSSLTENQDQEFETQTMDNIPNNGTDEADGEPNTITTDNQMNEPTPTPNNTPTTANPPANESPYQPVNRGTFTRTIQHDGLTRSYILHIPTNYDYTSPTPLVFVLHGGEGTAEGMLDGSKFTTAADQHTFIVVAPDGHQKNWNDARTGVDGTVDDVDFIATLLDNVANDYFVDTNRVFATGISNGGYFSQRLACDLPNTFAAIAPVASPLAATIVPPECGSTRIPVLGIQGSEDPFFPIYDGDGIPEMPRLLSRNGIPQNPVNVSDITAYWSNQNRCSGEQVTNLPTIANDDTSVEHHVFTNCAAPTEYYIVYGMGHVWAPGKNSSLNRLVGPGTDNLNATTVIWDFFRQF